MASTTKLIVYNEALRELGSGPIADLTSANVKLQTLDQAFAHAVEYMLAKKDWTFARRRATLTGVADTSFSPYTYRFSRPADFLRKIWVKTAASDAHQIDHAEVAAVIYGFVSSALIEYISDDTANYDPANWPPHFTRCVVLYLAQLAGPKIARNGAGEDSTLAGKLSQALGEADDFEKAFLTNSQIVANRQPVFRRAIEFMGQQLAGTIAIHSHADMLRWHMNEAWDHALKYVLEQGAWNFASRRATLTGGSEAIPGDVVGDIIEGYSLDPATETTDTTLPDMAGFDYGYLLPDGFLHKIWIKSDANDVFECRHQFLRDAVYTNVQPCVIEYVAWDDDSTNPENWTANFLEAVAAYLALIVAPELVVDSAGGKQKISAPQLREKLEPNWLRKLSDARLRDAIQQQPMQLPPGRFARARMGSFSATRVTR